MAAIPVINMTATGVNIKKLRKAAGLTVRDIQDVYGFSTPQAIYKWESGAAMPTIDNLIVLAAIFGVTLDDIIICESPFQGRLTA